MLAAEGSRASLPLLLEAGVGQPERLEAGNRRIAEDGPARDGWL
ncbi:hypothetical protein B8V81_1924 [Paenibacillus pasadenensis]|uniref:Uncharacterized protein n=1 Tax=Paenibacillus pasadenensis TaxID=217090 RepID=A0A2N5NBQ9_9BACL|nr:hypothetical protein [Paenibacillus pasadenensis]PLT47700.1 hypothetical protein B8V81_1924 [Paenibacillus pasadenensis]